MKRYLQFCLVGCSGLVVDMTILWLLASAFHWPISLSKLIASEIAVLNNFSWNSLWTFRPSDSKIFGHEIWFRFLRFNLVSLSGIAVSVGLVTILVGWFQMWLFAANALAIVLVSVWNYLAVRLWVWHQPNR